MSYTDMKVLKERLDYYESTLNTLLLKIDKLESKKRRKGNKKLVSNEDECKIHLSFAGLRRAYEGRENE